MFQKMEWSQTSARNAFLDTIKLCNKAKEKNNPSEAQEPESNEFLSALAAGMSAKVIVEVAPEVSTSTVALAAAARQTGGKVVCILPEPNLAEESHRVIDETGLNDMVEFHTGNPVDVLLRIENVDFSVVDCKTDDYDRLLEKLDVNPRRSVVVANNLVEGRKGLGGHFKRVENKAKVRTMKHPIGKGMEITMIGKSNEMIGRKSFSGGYSTSRTGEMRRTNSSVGIGMVKRGGDHKSKWVFKVDEKSGEEHIFRIPNS